MITIAADLSPTSLSPTPFTPAANQVHLMDPWWNPAVEEQAMDRVHRLGQTRPVQVGGGERGKRGMWQLSRSGGGGGAGGSEEGAKVSSCCTRVHTNPHFCPHLLPHLLIPGVRGQGQIKECMLELQEHHPTRLPILLVTLLPHAC